MSCESKEEGPGGQCRPWPESKGRLRRLCMIGDLKGWILVVPVASLLFSDWPAPELAVFLLVLPSALVVVLLSCDLPSPAFALFLLALADTQVG